ncbi:MAG: calcineurin-like phosphoesterase C-terminal domain-containing protein [Bacteroidales bacterium]|nr:calcineurin-like phosphoesterase C-terminal domain-containing protein [Bacteroidales bacterium]
MKTRNLLFIFLLALAGLLLASCNNGKNDPDEGEKIIITNVLLPSSLEIEEGSPVSIELRGTTHIKESDEIVLRSGSGTDYACPIISIEDGDMLKFQLTDEITSGTYKVYVRRAGINNYVGTMALTLLMSLSVDPQPGTTIYGIVHCDGKPVPGALVSDGEFIVKTDNKGIYQIASQKKWKYVFVIIPGGYMVPCQGVLPKFHETLSMPANTPERKDFELIKTDNDKFNLFVCGDFHLAKRNEDIAQFNKLAATLNKAISDSTGPCYIMTLGDMTWDVYWYSNTYQFPQYLETMNGNLSTPFFHTMGNHDNDMNSVGDYNKAFRYTRDIAPTFYSFNLGKIHFIVLDNIDYNNVGTGSDLRSEYKKNYTAEQMAWLAKDLSYVDKSTPVFITSHAPVSYPNGTAWSNTYLNGADSAGEANMTEFLSAVSTHKVHFLSGHTHNIFNRKHSANFSEHNSGAICGSWWWSGHLTSGIHLSQDGAPGGFGIWRFDGTHFTQSFQAGGHDIDYQFRAYDINKVKEYITPDLGGNHKDFTKYSTAMSAYPANTILVNVWDYDPDWTVKITENGKELGVQHVAAYDPLHIVALSGPRCKSSSASSTPSFLTGSWPHFFKATASSATSTVTVTVTDRNGKTYTETMTRPKALSVADYRNK